MGVINLSDMKTSFREFAKKLEDVEGYGCVETSQLGELYVFPINFGNFLALHAEFGKPVADVPKDVYLRSYMRFACFPKDSLREGRLKPKGPVLTPVDVMKLTDGDINHLAALICEHEPHLWSETIFDKREDSEGKTIHSSRVGNRIHEKNAQESDADFLYRLLMLQEQRMTERREGIVGKSLFSSGLGEGIRKALDLGDMLRQSIEPTKATLEFVHPERDLKLDFRDPKAELLAEISARLNSLIDQTSAATNFAVAANQIHTEIAEELKSSSDQAGQDAKESIGAAKQNITLTKWVIFLTSCSILLPLLLTLKGQSDAARDGIKQRELTDRNVNMVASGIAELRETIAAGREREFAELKEQMQKAKTAIATLEAENQKLLRLREADSRAIRELSEAYQALQKSPSSDGQPPQRTKQD